MIKYAFNKTIAIAIIFIANIATLNAQCTSSATMNVTIHNKPTITGTITNTNGCGNVGAVTTAVAGGDAPYTYSWSNGTTAANATGLTAGTYTVTVNSSFGCSKTASFVVGTVAGIPAPTSVTAANTCNSITWTWAGVNTGTYEVRYKLSTVTTWPAFTSVNTAKTFTANNLTNGATYNFQVRYRCPNGGTLSAVVSNTKVIPSCAPTITGYVFNTGACGTNTGEIKTAIGGLGTTSTYTWSTGSTAANISNLAVGVYTVTVSNNLGYSATASFTMTTATTAPKPQGATATAACNAVTLKWVRPTTGSCEVRYKLASATTWGAFVSVGTVSTYTVSGLTANTAYNFQVRYKCGTLASAATAINATTTVCGAALLADYPNIVVDEATAYNGTLSLYPNPTDDNVNIEFDFGTAGEATVEIFNMMGQSIRQLGNIEHDGASEINLSLNDVASGVYQVIVTQGTTRMTQKLIVRK